MEANLSVVVGLLGIVATLITIGSFVYKKRNVINNLYFIAPMTPSKIVGVNIKKLQAKKQRIERLYEIVTIPSVSIRYYGELILFNILFFTLLSSISFFSLQLSGSELFLSTFSFIANEEKLKSFFLFYGGTFAVISFILLAFSFVTFVMVSGKISELSTQEKKDKLIKEIDYELKEIYTLIDEMKVTDIVNISSDQNKEEKN